MSDILDKSQVLLPMGGLPNVFRQCPPSEVDYDRHKNAAMHSNAYALVNTLSIRHPTWVFINRLDQFSVYEKETYLGTITGGTDWKGNDYFSYYNDRVRKSLDRGNYRKAKSVASAVKGIEKYFYLPKLTERTVTANSALSGIISNAYSKASGEFRSKWNYYENTITAHIIIGGPLTDEVRAELKQLYTDRESAYWIMQHRGNGHGWNCLIDPDGTTHTFAAGTGDDVKTQMFDELPEMAQIKIGMLKLVNANGVTANIGARVGNAYYVTATELEQ